MKSKSIYLSILCVVTGLFSLIGCSNESLMGPNTDEISSLGVNKADIYLSDYESQLIGKDNLTVKDMEYIYKLPYEKRKVILEERGWKLYVYQGKSYLDNVLNYQEKGKSFSEEEIKELEKICNEKEKALPWDEFASTERWIPCENDVEIYSETANFGMENAKNDHKNSVDFKNLLSYGDPIVVHDGWCNHGWWRHAGIGIFEYKPGSIPRRYVISSYGNTGVKSESYTVYNNYDQGALLRVRTSGSKRVTAQNYAKSKIGYPYNFNWLWKWDTHRFYCSSLVWSAYYRTSPRIDIDATCHWWQGAAYNFVSPDDIYADGDTYVVQQSW